MLCQLHRVCAHSTFDFGVHHGPDHEVRTTAEAYGQRHSDPVPASMLREMFGEPVDLCTLQAYFYRVACDFLDFKSGRVGDHCRSPNGSVPAPLPTGRALR